MTQVKRKAVSLILAAVMLVSLLSVTVVGSFATTDSGITEAAGWFESAYVEWAPISGAEGYNVYVKAESASSWTRIDDMLIREYKDYWRADAVGLKAGNYSMKVVPVAGGKEDGGKALVSDSLTVFAYDRSGYGFVDGSASGAYNSDGTLKSDAQVIYVTAETAKTCTATVNGAVQTGLQTILDAKQKKGATETLCIRIIGLVTKNDLDHISSSAEGLQIKGANGYSPMNITIEGIGEDATISGFGMLIRNCKNVEIRNLGIMNFMDDGISVDTDNSHLWIHNCDFFYGSTGGDSDQAKGDGSLDTKESQNITYSYNHFWDSGKVHLVGNGDDSVTRITFHHNWYDHADSRMPRVRCGTVHVYNNFYDGVSKYGIGSTMDSDIFSENNYFLNASYPMLISKQGSDIATDSKGTFSGENGGMIKSFGDVIIGAKRFVSYQENSTQFDAYVASSRNEQVPSTVKAVQGGATYNNFDTASGFYSYSVQSAEDAMSTVKQYAGRMNGGDFTWNFTNADNADYDVNTALKSKITSYKSSLVSVGGNNDGYVGDNSGSDSGSDNGGNNGGSNNGGTVVAPTGAVVHNFGSNGTTSNFFTIEGNTSTSKGTTVYNGALLSTCLKMESSTKISFTVAEDGGTLTLVFGGSTAPSGKSVKLDGEKKTVGSDGTLTIELAAGAHTVTKGDSINLFYMVYTPAGVGEGGSDNGGSDNGGSDNGGSDNGGNNTGSGTVSGVTSGKYSFSTADITNVPSTDKTPLAEGTKFANDFFVIGGSVIQLINTTDGGVKSLEIGKAGSGWISFTIGADATVTIDLSSTGNDKTSVFAIVDGNGNTVANTEGVNEIFGGMSVKKTFTYNLSAGTYLLISPSGTEYSGRGVRLYSIVAVVGEGSDNTDTPENPGNTDTPENPGNTETPVDPDNGNTDLPGGDNNETPDGGNTETPENPSEDKNEGGEQNGATDDKTEDNQPEEKLNFFQKIFRAIANFFRMLFGGKKK